MKITAELRRWRYLPKSKILWGNVFNDTRERFLDGSLIHTSTVIEIFSHPSRKGYKVARTLNSYYLLNEEEEIQDD